MEDFVQGSVTDTVLKLLVLNVYNVWQRLLINHLISIYQGSAFSFWHFLMKKFCTHALLYVFKSSAFPFRAKHLLNTLLNNSRVSCLLQSDRLDILISMYTQLHRQFYIAKQCIYGTFKRTYITLWVKIRSSLLLLLFCHRVLFSSLLVCAILVVASGE